MRDRMEGSVGRPHVTIHSLASLDGRLDGFPPDLGLYYELAAGIPHQAVLSGSGTMLSAAAAEGVDMRIDEPEDASDGTSIAADLPWLVVVDSRGQLTRFAWLRSAPFWRDVLILCSYATPQAHRARLAGAGVAYEVVGARQVDLAAALDVLAERYGVECVRVDAGPALNGALLDAGLVDEVSVVVAPYLVGRADDRPLYLAAGHRRPEPAGLRLTAVEQLRDDHIWLRYAVERCL
jgi:2,5-diamino-6-(ribosylamino)-4(3H)-pyrimidinone 5'-phosphate reductase